MPVRQTTHIAAHHGIKSPKKKLVNVDSVMELLARGYMLPEPEPESQTAGGIRRVRI